MSDEPEICPIPCIICGKDLETAIPDGISLNQPYAGTVFWTQGHYGSTVFDPLSGDALEITICDPCLLTHADEQHVLFKRSARFERPRPNAKPDFWTAPR